MRVFITGISGYAGYYAALRLASAGHQVTGLVRHPTTRGSTCCARTRSN